jgi:hypothetical protein
MPRKKKRTERRVRHRRSGITVGEARRALEIEAKYPEKIRRSPRLRRALIAAKKLMLELAPLFSDADRAFESLSPEERRLLNALDATPNAFWGEATLDELRGMLKIVRGQKGAPRRRETQEKIRLAAQLTVKGVSQRQQGLQLFPNSRDAYKHTRTFYRRHRTEIERQVQQLSVSQQHNSRLPQ